VEMDRPTNGAAGRGRVDVMGTRFRGTFVIHWSQTEMDGQRSAPVMEVSPGRTWSWTGEAVRVDGPENVLPLAAGAEELELRKRAALTVKRLLSSLTSQTEKAETVTLQDPLFSKCFVLTNGRKTWDVFVLSVGQGKKPLLMFHGAIPPRDTDLWIVRHNLDETLLIEANKTPQGVICFTPGTMIRTPDGAKDIATLSEGDLVQTKDNGTAEVLWLGSKTISGARLRAMPDFVPIRIRAGALDVDVPDPGLLVSPDHRIVLKGARARALFNAEEVLVCARDLVNDHSIIRDHSVTGVSYIHMMLPQHEIVFANGVATESFHPASAAIHSVRAEELERMYDRLPEMEKDFSSYGGYARRLLAQNEAAILQHV